MDFLPAPTRFLVAVDVEEGARPRGACRPAEVMRCMRVSQVTDSSTTMARSTSTPGSVGTSWYGSSFAARRSRAAWESSKATTGTSTPMAASARGWTLPTPAHDLAAAGRDLGRATGLEPGVLLGVGHLEADLGHAQGVQELLHHALGVVEVVLGEALVPGVVRALARHDAADEAGARPQALALVAVEDAADLVESHVGHAVVEVVGHGAEKPGQHGAAHLGLLGHERGG